jgi:Protein of unknown function (DUF2490)
MRSRRLGLVRKTWLTVALFLALPSAAVRAQTSMTAFLPEVNSHFRLSANVRLVFDTKGYMEDGDLNRAQVGPSLQFNIRPLEKLKRITIFDMDDMKPMPVVFTIGYRYLPSSVQPAIHRLQPIVMFHIPFPGTILLSDRNRGDLDWSNGSFHWTYRNRFTGERRLTIHSYHPGAYASAEFFYQSQYAKWSSTRLYAGCLMPLSKFNKHLQLEPYYEHENNTGKRPNQHINIGGLILSLYFPPTRADAPSRRSGVISGPWQSHHRVPAAQSAPDGP